LALFELNEPSPNDPAVVIGVDTLREAADIEADIAITVYALDPADDEADKTALPPE
jgi:hypothetical protein